MDELVKLTACEAVARLKAGELSPLELIDAALARIEEVEPLVNALPTLCPERARERAKAIMAAPSDEAPPGYLHGLPIAIKDLNDVAGVRTTYGSPIFADHVPERSDLTVETLERHGAVVLAKSATPEFGAGANTFNEVFGVTRNPWDLARTCGGSSGGAAVALATGEIWLAQGSDHGGSLRIPASYCSVVGLRPSSGRVARGPMPVPFSPMSVQGPMARNVADLALLLDALSGAHPGDPLSLPAPGTPFLNAAEAPREPQRVAFSADLGFAGVDPEVAALCQSAAHHLGAEVVEACPDLGDAESTFQVLRGAYFAATQAPMLDAHRAALKPEVVWNIEMGLALTGAEIGLAERERAALYQRVVAFFAEYDLLLCPAVLAPPFPVEQRYLSEAAGVKFETYVSWLALSFAITLTHCPALSLPCGFTAAGLPVGLQIVGAAARRGRGHRRRRAVRGGAPFCHARADGAQSFVVAGGRRWRVSSSRRRAAGRSLAPVQSLLAPVQSLLAAFLKAFAQLPDPSFRVALLRSFVLSALVLAALAAAAWWAIGSFGLLGAGWPGDWTSSGYSATWWCGCCSARSPGCSFQPSPPCS